MADTNVVNEGGLGSFTFLLKTYNYFIGWGSGTTGDPVTDVVPTNTTLFTEEPSDSNDGTHNLRPATVGAQATVDLAFDTVTFSGTLTALADVSITESALFDADGVAADLVDAPSGGNMICQSYFDAPIDLLSGQSVDFIHEITFAN